MKYSLFIFTPCLPHHSHSVHWDQKKLVFSPLVVDQHRRKSFSLVCLISLEQPPAVCSFSRFKCYHQETSEDTSLLTWPFPLRHRHTRQPFDAMQLFHQVCYWTFTWLSSHWAWLCQRYWHNRNLIDWLIDWYGSSSGRPPQSEIGCSEL